MQADRNQHHLYHEHNHLLAQSVRQHHPILSEWVTQRPGGNPEIETEEGDLHDVHVGFPVAVCVFGTEPMRHTRIDRAPTCLFGLNMASLQSLVRQSLNHVFCNNVIQARIFHR